MNRDEHDRKVQALRQALIDGEESGHADLLTAQDLMREARRTAIQKGDDELNPGEGLIYAV
jgi:hypothetical protein